MPKLGLQPYAHTLPPPTATRRLALLTCSPRARRQVAFTVVSPSCTRCGGPTRSPGSIPAARTPSATQASRLSLPPPRRLALLICSPCACRLPSPSPSRRHRVRGAAPTHTLSQQHPRGTHPVRAPSPRLSHINGSLGSTILARVGHGWRLQHGGTLARRSVPVPLAHTASSCEELRGGVIHLLTP